jgi:hypothetical protein
VTARAMAVVMVIGFGLPACGGGGGGSVASFCSEVKTDKAKLSNASNSAADLAALKRAESAAPSGIKGDIRKLIDFIGSASPTHKPSASDIGKAATAGKNVTIYVKDKCKVDLNAGT